MEGYFKGYETEIHFTDEKTFMEEHIKMYHKAELISCGMSGIESRNRQRAMLCLELDSNPEFTANILLASARAAIRLADEKKFGAFTFLDLPPKYFTDKDPYSFV